MSQVPFPSRSAEVSGNQVSTIFSGTGVLLGVFVNALSGGNTSFSGQVARVQDATSGMAAIASGGVLFYNLDLGIQSGLSNGQNAALTNGAIQSLGYMEGFCNSGLVIQGALGFNVTVAFNK